MSTHFIYHIIGKKVGCTKRLRKRLKQQRLDLPHVITSNDEVLEGDARVEVLAVLTDVTDERAAQVEHAFAKIYGYKLGAPYTVNWSYNVTREQCVEAAHKATAMLTPEQRREKMRRMLAAITPEQHVENGRRGGKIRGKISGKIWAASFTHEQLSANGRKGAAIANARMTPEQKVANGRKGAAIANARMTPEQKVANLAGFTPEQRSENMKTINARRAECPRGCGSVLAPGAMGQHLKAGKCKPKP